MSDRSARQIWEASLGELQLQVPRPTYETWLKGTVGLEFQESEFVIGAPTPFVAECLEKRLYSLIARSLERTAQRPVEVCFRVMGEAVQQSGSSPRRDPAGRVPQNASLGPLATAGLNRHYTFDSFVVGSCNELAHAASQAVARGGGDGFNPLFLYSGVGLGKTHLLHSIAHRAAQQGLSWLYTSSEQFTNDFVRALQRKQAEEFREKYRGVEVLLIDDIQFMGGKEHSQEAFFHTFNQIHDANRQIVIASDRPPQALSLLQDRLRSRFEGGLLVDIKPPGFETRLAILHAKATRLGLSLGDHALELIATRVSESVRELEGSLNRVIALVQLTQRPVTLELVEEALANHLLEARPAVTVSPEEVISQVSRFYSLSVATVASNERAHAVVRARQVAMYLLREELHRPLVEIGKLLGGKNHATVLHACAKVSSEVSRDTQLSHDISQLQAALYQQPVTL